MLGLLAIAAVLGVALTRANELFVVSVRNGRAIYVRGRIPRGLLADINDVVSRAQVAHATIRVVFSQGRIRVLARGLDERVLQRLRNTVGIVPEHKLRGASVPRRRNLGQLLGLPWLAWMLAKR